MKTSHVFLRFVFFVFQFNDPSIPIISAKKLMMSKWNVPGKKSNMALLCTIFIDEHNSNSCLDPCSWKSPMISNYVWQCCKYRKPSTKFMTIAWPNSNDRAMQSHSLTIVLLPDGLWLVCFSEKMHPKQMGLVSGRSDGIRQYRAQTNTVYILSKGKVVSTVRASLGKRMWERREDERWEAQKDPWATSLWALHSNLGRMWYRALGFFLWSKDRWYKDTVHRTQIISTIIHQNGPNNHDILVPDELSFPMMYDT